MEELGTQELEELVQELEGESEEEEALSPEVEELLRDLQPARGFMLRLLAARQLGEISKSSRQVVQALLAAAKTDDTAEVRAAAAESLRAPVHQTAMQKCLDLNMEESQPQGLEELEGESVDEALPAEVHNLLGDLQPVRLYTSRRRAAEQLGEVNRSNREVVLALLGAGETDASAEVRAAAGESLRAPVHQAVLQQYPELGERTQAVLERNAAAQERNLQRALADETETGQSRLAYRLAAAVLFLAALVNIVNVALAWALDIEAELGLRQMLPILIDVGLGIGLIQLRKGARTWVLIRAGVGGTLYPILLFLSNDPITAAIMSVMQWGYCGALLLLLTGESKTWRLALAVAIFVVFMLGLSGVLILFVLLASAL